MGIRLYFERIPFDDFNYLFAHTSKEAYEEVVAKHQGFIDNWYNFMSEEEVDFQIVRRLCIEKWFWQELVTILTTPADDTFPTWNILGEQKTYHDLSYEPRMCAQSLGTFWMGYSPLYYIEPSAISSHLKQVRAIPEEAIRLRFHSEDAQDEEEAEEAQQFLEGIVGYHRDLIRFMTEAQSGNEAILWYIG
jgi:hypothetical protein